MPDRNEEESGEFKVIDRRLFTSDGERRPGAEMEPQPKVEPPPPQPPPAQSPGNQARADASPSEARPKQPSAVKFEHLVMSLITTAMFQMGMAASPGEPPPRPDFPAAQETIDLLNLLQQKTKGNLTREEEEVLTGGLYELRMAFVEVSRRAGRGH